MIPATKATANSGSTGAIGETDTSAHFQLSLLVGSALAWLIVSGVLSLIATIQFHTPSFLAACEALTHGRTEAMRESAFVYGWAANSGFAVATWILSRLGGSPLRGLGLMGAGVAFWNIGLTIGLVSIAIGEATSIPLLQMPAYVHPLLLVSFASIATPGILAWTGRRVRVTYAAQWYAVAALFLFPWLYSAAQVVLLDAPIRGVAQAVVANWFGQNVLTLWLLPIAIAAAYYLVPKYTAHPVANYNFALHGFWVLVAFGGWTGARSLVGGPVPAWIPAVAVVATSLLLFHYLIVFLNLREGLRGGSGRAPLEFVRFGLLAYLVSGLAAALFSFHFLAEVTQFTFFPRGQLTLLLSGAFSLMVFGALYEMLPRATGVAWPSLALIRGHLAIALLGLVVTTVALCAAGWTQGRGILDPETSFTAIAASTKTWLLAATAGEALTLLGAIVFAIHFLRLQAAACCPSGRQSTAAMEAPVS